MFGAFVNRFGSLLDRRFLLGSWFPALCGALLVAGAYAPARGWRTTAGDWDRAGGAAQLWLGVVAVTAITLVAFLLHVAPVVRLFEGYPLPSWIKTRGRSRQSARRGRVSEADSLRTYPRNSDLIRPTRLGNVLTAAEEHAYLRYRIDAVVWWPRFAPVLPQVFRDQLDEALLPLISLTSLALALSAGGVAGSVLLAAGGHWAGAVIYLAATALLAVLAYAGALAQAGRYAACVRAAFDLYRHDVLAAMRIAQPDDLIAERHRWEELTQWIYRGEPPRRPLEYTEPPEAAS
ncbi:MULTISPECIES: hypothetical protein [unclassified Streptomyces]|uniref:hypothetical protein n=1 Tax=unclassified Streptomyces TaxID=2593676 RepID=UPI0023660E7A|nr:MULTISPECIES: hypothetical protein [unclassified Streptomyces]MDF3148025.1 hypothetical protein [Streptomyces sp. T21Q-yed]WDF43177.1 hypothetical protein PBV52_43525 [Streptomyces sp. T12]